MLFKDQCVYPLTVNSYTETETEISSFGYKVFVGGSPVTEMRIFRNKGSIDAVINIENLIEFPNDMFFAYLNSFYSSGGAYSVPSPTKSAQIKVYSIVYTKTTGVTVETEIGSVTMSNIIDGKFGNYFPRQMIDQSTNKYVLLTNKYTQSQKVYITKNSYDVFSFYALNNCTLLIKSMNGTTLNTYNCTANNMYVVSLNGSKWGVELNEYKIVLNDGTAKELIFDVYVSAYVDALPIRRGTAYRDDGERRFNLFVKHPWGGLDHIANVNATSISGSSLRQELRIQDQAYIRGGSGNNFETTTQPASDFSTSSLPMSSEGRFSVSYEGYVHSANELWISAMAASKVGYLVVDSLAMNTIIEVTIDSISASIETIENEEKIWKISVSATQKIPFVA